MRSVLILLLILWSLAFFGSFIAFYLTPATDFGFTAGANKVMTFVAFQAVGLVLAIICLVLRWQTDVTALRRWATVPAIGTGLIVFGFGVLLFWASL